MNKTYDEQRRDRLADIVADYLSDDNIAAEKFCSELTQEVREWANYHKDQFDKANKILEQIDSNKIEWCHPESGISKNKKREYNLREAEYYNKRARLDAEHSNKNVATRKDWDDFWENSGTLNSSDC